jgi:hypothetical protein
MMFHVEQLRRKVWAKPIFITQRHKEDTPYPRGRALFVSLCEIDGVQEEEYLTHAKARRRKEEIVFFAPLRLCVRL